MALLAGTYETYQAIGRREDLADVIYNIDPLECPFMNSVGRGSASQTKHEWQTDTLDAAGFNVVDEGNDAAFAVPVLTVRPNNYLQISEKTILISGTLEAVSKAGRKSELAYQIAKKGKALKRDMEFTASRQQMIVTGPSATPRALASYENWIITNSDRGSGAGADPVLTAGTPSTAVVDGTVRPLLESYLKKVIRLCWTAGGDPTLIIAGAFNKQAISTFAGNSTRFDKGEDKALTAAIDLYRSDYGEHKIVASRFSRDRSVLVVDPTMWSFDYLRPFAQHPLAKTGDGEKRMLNVEWTLRASNALSSGVVADLTVV